MLLSKSIGLVFYILFQYAILAIANSATAQSTLVLDSVSVTSDNRHVVLGWTLQTSVTDGIIEIHRQLPNGLYTRIISLPLDSTSFVDTGADAQQGSWSYYIVARDRYGDNIAVSHEAHRTIFQSPPTFRKCERLIHVAWEGYRVTTSAGVPTPLPIPFALLRVVVWRNGIIYYEFTDTVGRQENLDISVDMPGIYEIKIIYMHPGTGTTSSSNTRSIHVAFPPQHSFLHVRGVSLDASSINTNILITADSTIQGAGYVFLRSDPHTGLFVALDTLYSQEATIMFTDYTSQANVRSEIYKVQAIDQCGEINIETNPIGTILLQVENIDRTTFELEWTDYEGWPVGIGEYQVMRALGNQEFEIIAVLSGNTTNYTDNLALYDEGQVLQNISYRIRSVESGGNQFGFRGSVLSNIALVNIDYDLFIPNAINISSPIAQNRVFRPVFNYFSPDNYTLSVFNRWGQQVFRTTEPLQGWDGSILGGVAPAGVYTFVIEFKNPDSSMRRITGVFMLLR